ncbi:GNAT family N-acetyltransferase [Actinomadura terrae]|uniref:GNAT family N-acetyltransferase n=1 Tax=Actinomadura terrae TaxID=604353 RepID=UPI001FA7342C|nr:GNAT family N-acetyltransferase [Actinomadura terrae]
MEIRRGGMGDVPTIMAMFDAAVAWLVANGRPDQWGTEPWSADPRKVERITGIARTNDIWIAELDGRPAGVLAVGSAPPSYVDAADEPELYVNLLLTARDATGRGVGGALLGKARDEARAWGVGLMRVDCYAGGGGPLVDYYRRHGFEPVRTVEVNESPVQVLAQRVTP